MNPSGKKCLFPGSGLPSAVCHHVSNVIILPQLLCICASIVGFNSQLKRTEVPTKDTCRLLYLFRFGAVAMAFRLVQERGELSHVRECSYVGDTVISTAVIFFLGKKENLA